MYELSRKEFIGTLGKISICCLLAPSCTKTRERKTAISPYQRGVARQFHRWYCSTFFDFTPHLSDAEHDYIFKAMDLMDDWAYSLNNQVELSTMSYSHRIEGRRVNSSRLAYGSLKYQSTLQEDIQKILHQRKILTRDIPDQAHISGLGWDIAAQHFKTYLYVDDLHRLKDPLLKALLATNWQPDFHRFGGVSYTFQGGKKFETKLYLYPQRAADHVDASLLPRESQGNITHMVTNLRGTVKQIDVNDDYFTAEILNDEGRAIYQKYHDKKWPLDTIAYHNRESFTLYF